MKERDPFVIPPPEMYHPEEISHWWFTGPVIALMVLVAYVLWRAM